MIQFVIVFVRSIIVIFGIVECGYPRYFSLFSASITFLFFGMFMNFYRENYSKKKTKKYRDWMVDALNHLISWKTFVKSSGFWNFGESLFVSFDLLWKQKTEILTRIDGFHFRHLFEIDFSKFMVMVPKIHIAWDNFDFQ